MKSKKANSYKSIFVISDMHIPYNHSLSDMLKFFTAIKKKYKPDKVVCIGDEVDYHAISFHDSDPDLLAAGRELKASVACLKLIYKIFNKVDVIDSNHGSLVFRRAKAMGLPLNVFKSYNDILEAPKGWVWHKDLTLTMSDGREVYFHHGKTAAHGKLSKNMSMSCVQGHYHSKFSIMYWANPNGLYWDMRIGCMIDDDSMAFHYNKTTMERPIIGCGIILNGQPKLLPMIKNKNGKWNGELP